MPLPETITINGKEISTFDYMLTPCETRDELHEWIKTFLDLDMPDCVVCEESTTSPMDMIWNCYKVAKDGDPTESSQLYFAARDAFKTLSAAIIELLMMLHFRRSCSHMGAIVQQADKCYYYLKQFLNKDVIRKIPQLKNTMKRTELDLPNPYNMLPYLQVIVCTMQGANCISKYSEILMGDGTTKLVKDIKVGDEIKTFDYLTGKFVIAPVKIISNAPAKYALKLSFSNGSNLVLSEDHPVFTNRGFTCAANTKIGDKVILNGVIKTEPYDIPSDSASAVDFNSFLVGTILGDSSLKWSTNTKKNKSYGTTYGVGPRLSCSHGLSQFEYLLYKKKILEFNGFKTALIKDFSPLGIKKQYKISTCVSSKFIPFYELFYPIKRRNTRKKGMTKNILRWITPEALAFWYMDDGVGGKKGVGRRKSRKLSLSTCSMSIKGYKLVIGHLKKQFNIGMHVHYIKSQYGTYPTLLCNTYIDSTRFSILIYPYVHYSMRNKLNVLEEFKKDSWCLWCAQKFDRQRATQGFSYCSKEHNHRIHKTRTGRKLLSRINTEFNGSITNMEYIGIRDDLIDIEIDTKEKHLKSFIANGCLIKNSEHTSVMCCDEIDVVQNVRAYREAKKIASEGPDKKPSLTLYISTRKSSWGLVQHEVDNAHKTGLKVRSWNIIDVAAPCPVTKSLLGTGTVEMYYKEEDLMLYTKEQIDHMQDIKVSEFQLKQVYPGCVNCGISALCLGRLATKQKSTSSLLKSHNDVEKKFKESTIDDAIAQLMCFKPATRGNVFTSFDPRLSVMNPTQMWEKFMGQKAIHAITKEELIDNFHKYHIPAYAGIDYGWESPSVCLVIFIDSKENVYVVHELAVTYTDDPEFTDMIKRLIHPRFKIQMYYPDIANPSGINLLKKADLPVSSRVDKDIHLGVQTIKKFMKVPGLGITKFFVLDDQVGLLEEIRKYHLKLDQAEEIISYDEYADEYNHRLDPCRYVLRSRLSRFNAIFEVVDSPALIGGGSTPVVRSDGSFNKVPTAKELAEHLGRGDFTDNKDDFDKDPNDPSGKTGGDSGSFSWSF